MTAYLRPRDGDPARVGTPTPVEITVDGEPVTALAGQTVAAALLSAGRDSWRTTRVAARPRGVFCGIGACHDCLVIVNGTPDIRACQRTIQPADTITTQTGAALPQPADGQRTGGTRATSDAQPREWAGGASATSDAQPRADLAPASSRPASTSNVPRVADVVVVGAGPAGIAAALAAADGGASVTLIDTGRSVGGQFNRQLPVEFGARRAGRLQHGWKGFVAQRDRLAGHERITHLAETSVWAMEGLRLWVQQGPADSVGRQVFAVDARAIVLATGAYDRVLPFPGWDLPGVYSAGAAQSLAKGQRISIGKRVLVAGTGPFLLPVAESLIGVGAEVVELLEANTLRTVRRGWLTNPLVASGKFREVLGYGTLLAKHRIPLRHGWTVVAAHGTDHVEAVTVVRLDDSWQPITGSERRIEVDAVCLGFGFTAQLELAVSARCNLTTGPDGGSAVVVDVHQETTTPGVFAAGELTGIGGADLAAAEGRVAGAAAALHAGTDAPGPPGARAAAERADLAGAVEAREAVVRGRQFAEVLARVYPVRDGWRAWSTAETVVCRCEEVTRGEIEAAVAGRGVQDGRALKLSSRAGLGMCQGRVCSRTVGALVGAPESSMKRPIAVPVRLRDLAEAQEDL
ncbi:2Fe-2S iron-sulfur cluster-binding protein [Kribbella sp. NBC_00889]|uniref:2Fe-2S iron-sulfur cluster-binding protein n=1 Tax=Kribbella sp. NBC_00889 TaxID=2975974 RepID=UPI00386DFC14|nr:2Fe-2S iron-sulfur cluster-binding protein [Kribbella sp. NBC_00889]